MLTPTDVLVGLLTLVSRPDGVELELGSMVFDAVAEEERDVDITVRALGENATTSVFEGIEVKHHKRLLDVIHVEQLCAKLRDMPGITAAGIVSGSGYTEPATKKARHNGVTLYSLADWKAPMEVAGVTVADQFKFCEQRYQWVGGPHVVLNPNLQLPENITKEIGPDTPVFDRNGAPLPNASTCKGLADRLASQLTAVAEQQGQPLQMSIGETRSVTFNINLEDEPFALVGDTRIRLTEARVTGEIEYVERIVTPVGDTATDSRFPTRGRGIGLASAAGEPVFGDCEGRGAILGPGLMVFPHPAGRKRGRGDFGEVDRVWCCALSVPEIQGGSAVSKGGGKCSIRPHFPCKYFLTLLSHVERCVAGPSSPVPRPSPKSSLMLAAETL